VDVIERYLELGLRLGRHADGLVDAYFGPPELAQRVDAEEVAAPARLVADAERLREDVGSEDGLGAQRRGWLDDQLRAIGTYASILGGAQVSYAEEVEQCFGVRPAPLPEERFAAAQARLEEILRGPGTLAERLEQRRKATAIEDGVVLEAFSCVRAILREATRARYGLPPDEDVIVELARDEPWLAYNYYLGDRRSRIAINIDRPQFAADIVELVAHEAYPGHHTEHATKEHEVVAGGVHEEMLVLVPAPQSMVSEGIAENAWDAVADEATTAAVVEALARLGVDYDAAESAAVAAASRDLRFVMSNVALMLHEDGATEEQGRAYVERWAAATPERAAASVRFVTDPLWRAYASTYSYGGALVRKHVDGRWERFAPLLHRQTRVADILAAVSSAP
jgi:hypothetical protein